MFSKYFLQNICLKRENSNLQWRKLAHNTSLTKIKVKITCGNITIIGIYVIGIYALIGIRIYPLYMMHFRKTYHLCGDIALKIHNFSLFMGKHQIYPNCRTFYSIVTSVSLMT